MHCAAVGSYDVWGNIIIPLLSALIGGGITMFGVIFTIRQERKKSLEQKRQDAKPWIFSLDPDEDNNYKNAKPIILNGNCPLEGEVNLEFIFRNTDNGIGIIEKFVTENNEYTDVKGCILDKNTSREVIIRLNTNETLNKMYFIIRDIYGNRYKYKASIESSSSKYHRIEEVGLVQQKEN